MHVIYCQINISNLFPSSELQVFYYLCIIGILQHLYPGYPQFLYSIGSPASVSQLYHFFCILGIFLLTYPSYSHFVTQLSPNFVSKIFFYFYIPDITMVLYPSYSPNCGSQQLSYQCIQSVFFPLYLISSYLFFLIKCPAVPPMPLIEGSELVSSCLPIK